MGANGFIRKIATIMSANVVGYSKLMDDDETTTAQTLTLYKKEMATLINRHRGRAIGFSCDNMLSGEGL